MWFKKWIFFAFTLYFMLNNINLNCFANVENQKIMHVDITKTISEKSHLNFEYLKINDYENNNVNYKINNVKFLSNIIISNNINNTTNKSIENINNKKINKTKNTYNMKNEYSFLTFIKDNLTYIFIIIIAIILFTVLNVIFVLRRNKKMFKELTLKDEVTGISNIKGFKIEAVSVIKKDPKEKYIVGFFDINNFKYINESFGREIGDCVLKYVSEIMASIKESICVARNNDDHFVVLFKYNDKIIEDIKSELDNKSNFMITSEQSFNLSYSCGFCMVDNSDQIQNTVDKAILAQRDVKGNYETTCGMYDEKLETKINQKINILAMMGKAFQEKEFKIFLQPKYDLKNLKIVGAEALVRWVKKDGSMIYPDQFIPVFEENGFVEKIDFFMLEEVCKMIRKYINKGIEPVVISVNQSRVLMKNPNYVNNVKRLIDCYHIPTKYIELEVTETMFTENQELIIDIMKKMSDIGLQISIDDFGSGYSSLNLLKDMPVDIIKIDKAFLNESSQSHSSKLIIQSIIELSKKLNIKVICEGVETQEQAQFLRNAGCDMAQGYLYAKPMPKKDFDKLMKL